MNSAVDALGKIRVKTIPCAITMSLQEITPEYARAALATSNGNRTARAHRLRQYCDDRNNEQWYVTHQGIAFDESGALVDGHHRLNMVVDTGKTTPMLVFRNVPSAGLEYIDAGLSRSSRDAFSMAGRGEFSNSFIAVARNLMAFPEGVRHKPSNSELLSIIHDHQDRIQFACSELQDHATGISRAVRCLVARAVGYIERDRLREFCAVLKTGMPNNAREDSSAVTYRNLLIRTSRNAGMGIETERYRKGQTALEGFAKRQPMEKLYGTEADLFPLVAA